MFIFTEAINCGRIAGVAVDSFIHHHPRRILYVFGTDSDFMEMGAIAYHERVVQINCTNDQALLGHYKRGHEGTGYIFAKVLSGEVGGGFGKILHFDSDLIFKKNIIDDAEKWLDEADLFGSRRCYVNNPAGIKVSPDLPDTISTYFFGMRRSAIPIYKFDELRRMCTGSFNPLGHDVFDFFDPVTFVAIKAGRTIKFVDSEIIGGQNEQGSKVNRYKSNMHLDMGAALAHFGGVGSGYAYHLTKINPNTSYANWALGRAALFAKLMMHEDIGYNSPAVYGPDGRWVDGSYDQEIFDMVRNDLFNDR